MEYITERFPAYDEWSEDQELIQGIRFSDGSEHRTRFCDDLFSDQQDNPVEVEFPSRVGLTDEIYIERYTPEYDHWRVAKNAFESALDEDSKTIDISKIKSSDIKEHFE